MCDDEWDDTDAGVVCRQLGFGLSGTAIGSAGFGQGSGPILLDKISCNGSEPILARCGHLGINVIQSCSHAEDAGVMCSGLQGKGIVFICNNNAKQKHPGCKKSARPIRSSIANRYVRMCDQKL